MAATRPRLVISYNYDYIIPQSVIQIANANMINLHISYLPWNRGFSPNIWSFIDDTPKGVTIHELTAGLDRGDIIVQQEMEFEVNKETLVSTYDALNKAISELLKNNWDSIWNGSYTSIPQGGEGTYHSMRDLDELRSRIKFSWNDNVSSFLERYWKTVSTCTALNQL